MTTPTTALEVLLSGGPLAEQVAALAALGDGPSWVEAIRGVTLADLLRQTLLDSEPREMIGTPADPVAAAQRARWETVPGADEDPFGHLIGKIIGIMDAGDEQIGAAHRHVPGVDPNDPEPHHGASASWVGIRAAKIAHGIMAEMVLAADDPAAA